MMNSVSKFIIAFAGTILIVFGGVLNAQTKDTTNTILFAPTTVVGQAIEIPKANKLEDKPQLRDTVYKRPELSYTIRKKQIPTSFELEPIVPAKMKKEKLFFFILQIFLEQLNI